jgi:hypothetical protein
MPRQRFHPAAVCRLRSALRYARLLRRRRLRSDRRINNAPVPVTRYCGRRAVAIENDEVRVTVLAHGGHIAEVFDKRTGVNPLWTPPWTSIEPPAFDEGIHGDLFGRGSDARLLAGIMGHNLCLDIFGGPSDDEAAAGLSAHGEGSDVDRPIGWTQHVTLGPPFLEKGITQFRASATRSCVHEGAFGPADYLAAGAPFDWPAAPRREGGVADLRRFTDLTASSAYTAHLMTERPDDTAFFVAFSPRAALAFGYVWRPSDFPWMGIWEENGSRTAPPWNGSTVARGMEFGVSPFPETRRAMVDRGRLFDVPTYRWLPARRTLTARYAIVVQAAERVPETLTWP